VWSGGGWAAVQALRRGREGYAADERILGGSAFVEEVRQEVEAETTRHVPGRHRALSVEAVVGKVCQAEGVRVQEVAGGGRRAVLCRAREGIAYLWEWLGHTGTPVAQAVGIRPEGVYRVGQRGRQQAGHLATSVGAVGIRLKKLQRPLLSNARKTAGDSRVDQ
jgi:hypothetical protein